MFCVQDTPYTSFRIEYRSNLKSSGLEDHRHLSLIPFLWASRPSVCGLAGRGIIVFPCCRRSELVLGSLHPLRWLEHGNVLRSYEVFKVQVRESNVEGVELGDCETGSYPLVINGEKGG